MKTSAADSDTTTKEKKSACVGRAEILIWSLTWSDGPRVAANTICGDACGISVLSMEIRNKKKKKKVPREKSGLCDEYAVD